MAKPADFFIGVVDFFAVLLPGAVLVYLLQPRVVAGIPSSWLPAAPAQGWVAFLVLAYIAGHLLHAIGSWLLDPYVYGKLYLPRWRSSHVRAASLISKIASADRRGDKQTAATLMTGLREDGNAAETLLARVYLTTEANAQGTNYYDWCLSDVRVHSPAGSAEVDRLQADSKFFRSMVFVFLVAALISLGQAPVWVPAGAATLTLFALWRYCELRWTATKRVYEYYLLLHPQSPESRSVAD